MMRSSSKRPRLANSVLVLVTFCVGANVFEAVAKNQSSIPLNVLNINKTLLVNRVNATVNAALNTQPSLNAALATVSGKLGSARSAKNATKDLARSYWFLNRTVAYNPTNRTQLEALATYTYKRLQFESLLKQGYAFKTTSAVTSSGGNVTEAASNITCFFDPSTGIVTNLQQASKLACTSGGKRVVIPSAGKYVTKLEMAIDKELPLIGRFVFHVRDTLDSKPNVYTCGFAGGEAISLFPPGYIATSVDVGCIPLTPQAIGKKRKLLAQAPKNAANPELVTAVVVSESIAKEQSPDKPVSAAVVATGVVRGSTFAVDSSSLSPEVEKQIEQGNNQTTTCPSGTPDICSAVGGGNVCVNLATDRNRCGSCTSVCPSAQSCVSGACSCPAVIPDLCGSACVNKATDVANCGACGNACPAAQSCVSGACACPVATPDLCGPACVNKATDVANCGACGNACPAAQSCVSGACACPVATPDLCGSACVNKATDVANCGACGNACAATQLCVSGSCSCPAAKPDFCAATGCVDLATDKNNCGSCGNACPADSTCNAGVCTCCGSGLCAIGAATILYSQDFAQNASGWVLNGAGSVVQSSSFTPKFRTNVGVGQVQMTGAGTVGPYTRFRPDPNGPPFFTDFSTGSPNGFASQLAMYFDLGNGNGIANDKRVDYSVALSTKDNVFVQDFVFNFGFYDDNTGPGAGQRRVVVSVSNDGLGWPKNPQRNPVAIATSGWYIFQHKVYPLNDRLYVNLSIFSADCNQLINTWTLGPALVGGNPATPLTVANAGYLRYGLFNRNQWPSLALNLAGQAFGVIQA